MLLIKIDSESSKRVLFYGHLDKQPHFTGWLEETGPTTPKIINGRLYGWGSADDGYAVYLALLAIKCALDQGKQLPQIIITLETEEESGSANLEDLLKASSEQIGVPDICICLDSWNLDFNRLWMTSTLRGVCNFTINIEIASQGTHSGLAGGILPDTIRIFNMLMAWIEDPETGMLRDELQVDIPEYFQEEANSLTS